MAITLNGKKRLNNISVHSLVTLGVSFLAFSQLAYASTHSLKLSWEKVEFATQYKLMEKAPDESVYSQAFLGEGTLNGNRVEVDLTELAKGEHTYKVISCLTNPTVTPEQVLCEEVSTYSAELIVDVGNQSSGGWGEKGGTVASVPLVPKTVPTANTFQGITTASGGVSGGAASYSIPVVIPPGRNGMQPSVSLSYSSRSGNGIAGVGFGLNAGGAISRCAPTLAQDGFQTGIQFNSTTDRLCLNGQRLIATVGSYGNESTVYRTEIDSFVLVKQKNGNLASSSTYFEVKYPSGQVEYYGNTVDSRVSPTGTSQTLTWQVSKTQDASGNNHISYHYKDYGDGEKLLEWIRYTGNGSSDGTRAIGFTYENREKFNTSYLAGSYTRQTQRLQKITTYVDLSASANSDFGASDKVREYTLAYKASSASARSLVSSITECGYTATSDCRDPIVFEWQDAAIKYKVEEFTTSSGTELVPKNGTHMPQITSVLPQGDINGDGARDWPYTFVNAEGDKTGDNTFDYSSCHHNRATGKVNCIGADFNLDGRTDSWKVENNKLVVGYTQEVSPGSGTWTTDWKPATQVDISSALNRFDEVVNIADYNADGWPDVVVKEALYRTSTSDYARTLYLYLHSQNTAAPYSAKTFLRDVNNLSDEQVSVQMLGDMDGNGLPDFALSRKGNYQITPALSTLLLTKMSSTGTISLEEHDVYFNQVSGSTSFDSFSMFLDVNGDGLDDWLGWMPGTQEQIIIKLNKGNGTFGGEIASGVYLDSFVHFVPGDEPGFNGPNGIGLLPAIATPRHPSGLKPMDIDGDGSVELLMPSEIVAESCQIIKEYSQEGNFWQDVERCGHEILEPVVDKWTNGSTFAGFYRSADLDWDRNIYSYRALKFTEDQEGNITASSIQTPIVGGAQDVSIIDAFGNGLQDMVFAYGCHTNGCIIDDAEATGSMTGKTKDKYYFTRNYGSTTVENPGKEDYHAPDMLVKVENGKNLDTGVVAGTVNEWDYRPLSSGHVPDMYSVDFESPDITAAENAEHFLFASSMYVVNEHRQSNGLKGSDGVSLNATEYRYTNAMFNTKGRGFRGFEEIIEIDTRRNSKVVTDFEQVFPKSSLIEKQSTFILGNATPISEVTNQWELNSNHTIAGVYHLFNAQAENKSFAANTTQLSSAISMGATAMTTTTTTVAQSEIDSVGNISEQITTVVDAYFGQHTTTATAVFDPVTSYEGWWPNKLTSSTVKKETSYSGSGVQALNSAPASADKTVTTHIEAYDTSHRKPKTVTVAPGASAVAAADCNDNSLNGCQKTSTLYNTYGLPTSVSVEGTISKTSANTKSAETRTTTTNYAHSNSAAADGYFPYEVTQNSHTTTIHTQPETGQPLSSQTPSLVTTTTQYDSWARPNQVSTTGYPAQYLRYLQVDGNGPNEDNNQAIMMVQRYQSGTPDTAEYKDMLGRTLRTRTTGFDGQNIFTDVRFDNLGRTSKQSAPHQGSAVYTQFSGYDALDRPRTKVTPATQSGETLTTTYWYNNVSTGIATVASDGHDLVMSRSYNAMGQLMNTVDADGEITAYSYDAAGNPIAIKDAAGNSILAVYDDLGRKQQVDDPNQGVTTFVYNDFGELEIETDANDKSIWYERDKFGRVTQRLSNNGENATFVWDTKKKGLLSSEALDSGEFSKAYEYDSAARIIQATTTVSGESPFVVITAYDANHGRPLTLTYPNNLIVAYEYNVNGYLLREYNAGSGYVYREVTAQDAWGNIANASIADGSQSGTYTYSSRTGQMLSSVVAISGQNRHYLDYEDYDSYGNLKTQQNRAVMSSGVTIGTTETFTYDKLHRLTNSLVSGSGFNKSIDYGYDVVGNLKWKTDYSADNANAYSYEANSNKLASVQLAGGDTLLFAHDNKGNLTGRGVGSITTENVYNVFNKPTRIERLGSEVLLSYGADLSRYKQVRTVNKGTGQQAEVTTYYIDKLYEVEKSGGSTTSKAFISDVAILIDEGGSSKIRFTHKDRLGSATTLTDHNGNVTAYRGYDAFGKPRGGDWSELGIARMANNVADSDLASRRGFTDHEHLDEVEIIHMNGRVYDYNVGRFMSVDPFIQGVGNSQGINPYSYVMNNPLRYTDPTGYSANEDVEDVKIKGTVKTEKVATTGSRIKNKTKTTVSGTVTKADGSTKSFSYSQKGNGKISGSVSRQWSKAGGNKASDIGSPNQLASTTATPNQGTSQNLEKQYLPNSGELLACNDFDCSGSLENTSNVFSNQILNGNPEDRVYITYIKINPITGQVYVGRTSGFGTPEEIVRKRDLGHIRLRSLGFGSATIESSIQTGETLRDYFAIRGREQQLITRFGGVGHENVANRIRGVSKKNPLGRIYHQASNNAFGEIADYDGNY